MRTRIVSLYGSLCGAACAGGILLVTGNTSGQNLLVGDYTTDAIYEFTPSGTQSTFATGMNFPFGMALDSQGNLFVANTANNPSDTAGNITKITPGGVPSVFASGLDPDALAFNSAGNLFVSDYLSGNIYQYTPGGVRSTFATGLQNAYVMTIDSMGNLYVGGQGSSGGYITKFAPNGTQSLFASGLSSPEGLTFDISGNLYEANNDTGQIFKFTPGGVRSTFASGINNPNNMVFDSAGDMFVTTASGAIIKITPGGAQSTFATVPGIPDGLLIVPEPSMPGLFGAGALVCLAYRHGRKVSAKPQAEG